MRLERRLEAMAQALGSPLVGLSQDASVATMICNSCGLIISASPADRLPEYLGEWYVGEMSEGADFCPRCRP